MQIVDILKFLIKNVKRGKNGYFMHYMHFWNTYKIRILVMKNDLNEESRKATISSHTLENTLS